jgi:pimeloyl-ACP methyl ester carboxylesterase
MAKPPFIPPSVLNYLAHAHYVDRQQELSHMFSDFFDVHDFFDKPIDIKPHRLMIVWGHEDQLLPVADAEVWENLTQCQPIIYSGLGHMPMVEAPKQTYKDCKIFIDQRLS